MSNAIERQCGSGDPTHAVIWLHGLGATADDFVPVVPHLGLPADLSVRFIFPQAPNRPITVNGGFVMPGWYDIKGMDIADKEDLHGMTESRTALEALVAEQVALGIPSENIVLAGFSQGGAVAYYTGIRSQHKLGGILALSTYLPFLQQAEAEHSKINQSTPIMAMHGTQDPVVPIALGRASMEGLKALGYEVAWNTYPMDHSVNPEQIVDIGQWLTEVLKP